MNILRHELKANLKSTVIWLLSLGGMFLVFMAFYPMIKSDLDTFTKLMENFPPAMKAIFGIAMENFANPVGYYGFVFTYTALLGAIQAMNLGVGILSKETRERTADFLMTKPVSRPQILTMKLLAALTLLLVTDAVYTLVSYPAVRGFSDGDFENGRFLLINLSLFFLQLIFFSVGLAVSSAAKKIKAVLPVSLGLVFGFFAVSAFAVTSKEDKLRYLTPFQYFKADSIALEGRYETAFAVTGLFVVLAGITASYILYKRRDIQSV